ncbi:thiol reductant ABC exporter subunit CydC [Gluconacetobacter azotocaptans]|uniref:Thiol reductant ABC exporter subunit CydC n=2 Tax=Gluconacetobacter azotocaptans TaxID=142834 RepID=A0A7W4JTN3_9PROT|nr:thiol reductant ABC exporter subunit CydC [Gluconacetobacter azotocaptans]GBQ26690.1 transport ATP-binding protein CydD [Gluconacetobacter azotocaptans DSM 13594]
MNMSDKTEGGLAPVLRILSLWRARAPLLIVGGTLSLLAVLAGLVLMQGAGMRLAGTASGALVVGVLLLRVSGIGRVVLRYVERLVTHDAMFRALADVRVWFFRHLAGGAAAGLGFRRAGDLLSRLVSDVEALDALYLRILVPLAGACLILPFLVLAVLPVDPALAMVVGGLFVTGAFVLPLGAALLGRRQAGALTHRLAGLRIGVLDLVSGLREIRAFGAEGRVLSQVRERDARLFDAQAQQARLLAMVGGASYLCGQAAMLAVLAAALGVGFGPIPPVRAAGLLFLVVAGFEGIGGLTRAGALAGGVSRAAARVISVGGQEGPAVPVGTLPAPADTHLRFEQVGFRWRADRAPVFDGLTLDIPAGSRVAVLGPSGIGKSTLAALLLKVAAPTSGRIMLGGQDLADLDSASVRRRVAWLSQVTHLFADTIRANLLLGRPDATEAELWAALERAQIGDLVRSMPDGLDSWLGEGGTTVSGGQGRRIALARTLLSDAPILILDEPATGLDAETERDFLLTLNTVTAGRTVILIAHRLVGVERLDRIWRLSDGRANAVAA